MTRTRTTLVDERAAAVNRLQKVLEYANLKLAGVATDVAGASSRAIFAALLAGETDPVALAALAKGRLRAKRADLERALNGRRTAHHRLLLATHLGLIDFLNGEIARLDTIPGVDRQTAEVLLAEVGAEMGRFPTPRHLDSWAGMCLGSHESAGKRTRGKTRKGSTWLRRALTEAAHGAARTKQAGRSALASDDRRLVARRGKKKATSAVGHHILVIAYHVLRDREEYREPTPLALDEHRRRRAATAPSTSCASSVSR